MELSVLRGELHYPYYYFGHNYFILHFLGEQEISFYIICRILIIIY